MKALRFLVLPAIGIILLAWAAAYCVELVHDVVAVIKSYKEAM